VQAARGGIGLTLGRFVASICLETTPAMAYGVRDSGEQEGQPDNARARVGSRGMFGG
jgi:hypothetical protein